MRNPKLTVFDSWAIMAYLEDEPAAERIVDAISDTHDEAVPLLMFVLNAGEIRSIIARKASPPDADRAINLFLDIGIKFIGADLPLTKIPAGFKV